MATNDVSLRELAEIIKRIDSRTSHIDEVVNHISGQMKLPSGITFSNAIGQILNAVTK